MAIKDAIKKRKEEKAAETKPTITGIEMRVSYLYSDNGDELTAIISISKRMSNNLPDSDSFDVSETLSSTDKQTLLQLMKRELKEYKDAN